MWYGDMEQYKVLRPLLQNERSRFPKFVNARIGETINQINQHEQKKNWLEAVNVDAHPLLQQCKGKI